jgi:hypothetical protein
MPHYSEQYLVTLTTSDGIAFAEPFEEEVDADIRFNRATNDLKPGERVELSRRMTVVLASAIKAR